MQKAFFSIRPATPDESSLLTDLTLRSKSYWGYEAAFMEACRPALTFSPQYILANPVFILEWQGSVVGYYSLRSLSEYDVDLDNLFVEPAAIGKGCGKRLWQHAVATAQQLGFSRLRIEADPNAESFYLAMGAERDGSVLSTVWPDRELPVLYFSLV